MEREPIRHNDEELDRGPDAGGSGYGGGTSTPREKKGLDRPTTIALIVAVIFLIIVLYFAL